MPYEFNADDIRAMIKDGSLGDFLRAQAGLQQSGRRPEEEFVCPHCKARPGQRCVNLSTGHTLKEMHPSRAELLNPLPPEPIHPVGHWPDVRRPGGEA